MTYGCGATGRQSCQIFGFWPIFPLQNPWNVPSGDQPTAHGLHRRIITIFPCGSRRSKGMPSDSAVFLRLLVEELGTPKLVQSFAYGKWLYPYWILLHGASDLDQRCLKTCNYKDRCTFLQNIFAPTPILGDFLVQTLLYRELSVNRTLTELRSWNVTARQVL